MAKFDMWRFMSSPNAAADAARGSASKKKKKRSRPGDEDEIDNALPWVVSLVFFVFLARVILGSLILLVFAWGFGDPLPVWFSWLVIAHGLVFVIVLVFVLNGWGWARLAVLVMSLSQLLLDQTAITRWYLLFDVILLVVLMLKPAAKYFANCAAVRGH